MAKTIIDTDVGCDDAIAILMCLRANTNREIIGITTLFGNVHVDQATKNAGVLLKHAGREDVTVYKGAQDPIIGTFDPSKCWQGHGCDGIGGQGLTEGVEVAPLGGEAAAVALVNAARQHPGQLEILALGPLTNLALAIKLDPSFASNVKHVVLMGGCELGKGNSSHMAEFNFHADPEAAHIVINSLTPATRPGPGPDQVGGAEDASASAGPKITMVTWECTYDHQLPFALYDQLTPPLNESREGRFLSKLCAALMTAVRSPEMVTSGIGFLPCDAYAAAVLEDPSVVTQSQDLVCDVEVGGRLARGSCAFDWFSRSKGPANVRVVQKLDVGRVEALLRHTFAPHPS